MSHLDTVDRLLADLAAAKHRLDKVNGDWSSAIQELERQYGELARAAKDRLKDVEKELRKYAKKHRTEIFGNEDRVDTQSGAVIYRSDLRVKRAKAVTVQKLKDLGYTDGVRVEEKVWWDRLEDWPDEKLAAVGTERVRKEEIEWELKEEDEYTSGRWRMSSRHK